MWILYNLMKDVHTILAPEKDISGFKGLKFAGSLLPRAYFTVLGNTVVFLYIMSMLGMMVSLFYTLTL